MNVLIACDKFKGSLSAAEVCQAIATGIQKRHPDVHCLIHPMADGGDGSLEVIANYFPALIQTVTTSDPLGRLFEASYLIAGQTAYIELAAASGLVLLSESERNPLYTSTAGTGLLIKDALAKGCSTIYLFAGGSATNDAGMGIAQVLGFTFLNKDKNELQANGANLLHIRHISPPKKLEKFHFQVLSDVTNPLFGPKGAAYIYAAQKGANAKEIELLDQGLKQFSQVLQQQPGRSVENLSGGGCAGGLGAGMVGLLGATIRNGFEAISEITHLEVNIQMADVVITGEGKLDEQTLHGKVVGGIARLCQKHQKPLVAFAGINQLSHSQSEQLQLRQVYTISDLATSLEDAMNNGAVYLEKLAEKMAAGWG